MKNATKNVWMLVSFIGFLIAITVNTVSTQNKLVDYYSDFLSR